MTHEPIGSPGHPDFRWVRCVYPADRVFVSQGTFSWSHLGVRCEYGIPERASDVHGFSLANLVAGLLGWRVTASGFGATRWRRRIRPA